MFKRIWCHFFGHRPRRHRVEKNRFSAWTVCGHCGQLMARGYFGWQLANDSDKRHFKRAVAKRDADFACRAPDDTGSVESFALPWEDMESTNSGRDELQFRL